MASIVKPDNAIIDYTTIQSMIVAIEELQTALSSNPTAMTQKIVKNLVWVVSKTSSKTIDFSSAGFTSAPVVVVTIVENDKDKKTNLPPHAFLYGKPTKDSAVVKFSKAVEDGCWISWIAVGTVAS